MIEFHELGKIKLGLLEDLSFSDQNIFKREDLGAVFGNLLLDLISKQLLEEVLQGNFGDLTHQAFHNLLAEELLLGTFGVTSGLNLVLVAASESNSEEADHVTIKSLGLDEGLNKGVPFLDKSAELVTSDVHTVEVGVAIETLDFFDLELDLSPCEIVSLTVKFTKRNGENATTKTVGSDL